MLPLERYSTYKGTGGTEEVLVRDGRVYVLVNKGASELADYTRRIQCGGQRRMLRFVWNEEPRIRLLTWRRKKLWEHKTTVAPLSLTAGLMAFTFTMDEAGYWIPPRQCALEYGPGGPPFRHSTSGSRSLSIRSCPCCGGDRKMPAM